MATVYDVEAQINATGPLFESQKSLGLSAESAQEIHAKTLSSIAHQVQNIGVLNMDGAQRLNDALSKSGFSMQGRTELAMTIANHALASVICSTPIPSSFHYLLHGVPFSAYTRCRHIRCRYY